jgi:hypothetical protein
VVPDGAFVEPDEIIPVLNPQPHTVSHPGNIHVRITVSGTTPAKNVHLTMECKSGDWETSFASLEGVAAVYPPNTNKDYICSPNLLKGRNPIKNPTGTYVDQKKMILPGAIWVKGRITYDDIFSSHHASDFCFQNESGWNHRDLTQCKEGNGIS